MVPSGDRLDRMLCAVCAIRAPPLTMHMEARLALLAPVRTRSPAGQLAFIACASFAFAALNVAALGARADLHRLPASWLLAVGLAWAAGFTALLAVAMIPRRGSMLPSPTRTGLAMYVGPIAMIAFGAGFGGSGSASMPTWGAELRQAAVCLFTGLEIGAIPFACASVAMRRVLPLEARAVGASLGAAGGALGALALHFRCAAGGPLHVGVAHGGTAALGAVLGGAVLTRIASR